MTGQSKMTADEFREHITALFGKHGGQTAAAEYLGISPRTIRKYVGGEKPVPDDTAKLIAELRENAPLGMLQINPQREIARIQRLMTGSGWDAGGAAAGILGAALANARAHADPEFLQTVLKSGD